MLLNLETRDEDRRAPHLSCYLSRMTSSSSTGEGLSRRLSSSASSLPCMVSTRERAVSLPQRGHCQLQSAGGDLSGGQAVLQPGQRMLEKWVPASVSSRHLGASGVHF